MKAIVRKELADYFTSVRVLVLFALVFLASAAALYADYSGIRGSGSQGFVFLRLFTTSGSVAPSLANLFALFFIPLIGIALGFDAINSERTNGTLSQVISQPIYRDSIVNGKFIAALVTLAILVGTSVLLVAGYGLRMIGVPPNAEEIIRLFIYLFLSVVYGAFWIGLAILFSVIFRKVGVSLLFSLALWLFFSVFFLILARPVADAIAPITNPNDVAQALHNVAAQQTILRFSPNTLFSEATQVLLHPVLLETGLGQVGALQSGQAPYMLVSSLSLGQSMIIVWPHLTTLISLSVVCFSISYVLFMRQEIRAT